MQSTFASHADFHRVHSACYRMHCILMNRRDIERQLNCLRFLRSSRQVDCARKNRQLSDLYVLIKSLVKQRNGASRTDSKGQLKLTILIYFLNCTGYHDINQRQVKYVIRFFFQSNHSYKNLVYRSQNPYNI